MPIPSRSDGRERYLEGPVYRIEMTLVFQLNRRELRRSRRGRQTNDSPGTAQHSVTKSNDLMSNSQMSASRTKAVDQGCPRSPRSNLISRPWPHTAIRSVDRSADGQRGSKAPG